MHSELLKVVAKGKKGAQRGRTRVWLCGCHRHWGQAGSCLPASSRESSSLPEVGGRIPPTSRERAARELASWARSDSLQWSPGASNNAHLHPLSSEARGPRRRYRQSWFLLNLPSASLRDRSLTVVASPGRSPFAHAPQCPFCLRTPSAGPPSNTIASVKTSSLTRVSFVALGLLGFQCVTLGMGVHNPTPTHMRERAHLGPGGRRQHDQGH